MSEFGDELFDGFSAQQIFRDEESDGLTFDDIIALVRLCCIDGARTLLLLCSPCAMDRPC